MVRMIAQPPIERISLMDVDCPRFDARPWVHGKPLSERRVAMISSAALIQRGERAFIGNDARIRPLPDSVPAAEILTSHVSVNFDRTGMQMDLNCAFPRERLHALVDARVVGAVAETHYAFMGSVAPALLQRPGERLAARLRDEDVDSALLIPV